jgi:hypothetical protein
MQVRIAINSPTPNLESTNEINSRYFKTNYAYDNAKLKLGGRWLHTEIKVCFYMFPTL